MGKLLILGPGTLGKRVGVQWSHSDTSEIAGVTRTNRAHAELRRMGISPATQASPETFSSVLICVPPTQSDDYVQLVKNTARNWLNDATGSLVFTSSAGVYSDESAIIDEHSPLKSDGSNNDRSDVLINAENAALDAGGIVIRLAGLYHSSRGAHSYYLKGVSADSDPATRINQIHYDDAADLCFRALRSDPSKLPHSLFNGADGSPTRRGDIPTIAKEKGKLDGQLPNFLQPASDDGTAGVGKILSAERARTVLGWSPSYSSFTDFMTKLGNGTASEFCEDDYKW